MYIYLYTNTYLYIMPFQIETEAQAYFFSPFTVCSSYKRKFVVCPFVDEENPFQTD